MSELVAIPTSKETLMANAQQVDKALKRFRLYCGPTENPDKLAYFWGYDTKHATKKFVANFGCDPEHVEKLVD